MKISVVSAKYQSVWDANFEKPRRGEGQPVEKKMHTFSESEVSVRLSHSIQTLDAAEQGLEASPNIRKAVVQPISEAIEKGRYHVKPEKIAEKMIGSIIDSFA